MKKNIIGITLIGMLSISCVQFRKAIPEDSYPPIFPDYTEVTIPATIAPLHFLLTESVKSSEVHIEGAHTSFIIKGKNTVRIPQRRWKKALQKEDTLRVTVKVKYDKQWKQHKTFHVFISSDPIDDVISYRRIKPGYVYYNAMGIYQRELSSYKETALIENTLYGNSCVNCHAFANNNPEQMQFHIRGKGGGTLLKNKGEVKRLDPALEGLWASFRYPYWHPNGKYIAYTLNNTLQTFHNHPERMVDVFDTRSDIVIYDVENNKVIAPPALMDTTRLDTFPAFSADGETLYFCSAKAPLTTLEESYYGLKAVSFNPATGEIGDEILDVFSPTNKSIAFPRPSPDGRYLTFTHSDYGTFPIWHKEADIWIIDMESGEICVADHINSTDTDSYHTWSTNSKWLAFASRRLDGLHTRIFIAHMNDKGVFEKPFLLPQKNPKYHLDLLESYNIPEFVSSKIILSKRDIRHSETIKVLP